MINRNRMLLFLLTVVALNVITQCDNTANSNNTESKKVETNELNPRKEGRYTNRNSEGKLLSEGRYENGYMIGKWYYHIPEIDKNFYINWSVFNHKDFDYSLNTLSNWEYSIEGKYIRFFKDEDNVILGILKKDIGISARQYIEQVITGFRENDHVELTDMIRFDNNEIDFYYGIGKMIDSSQEEKMFFGSYLVRDSSLIETYYSFNFEEDKVIHKRIFDEILLSLELNGKKILHNKMIINNEVTRIPIE